MKISGIFNSISSWARRHSPEIFIGFGIAGSITALIFAIEETPKAMRAIEEEKEIDEVDELSPVETVKTVWKYYIPAAATEALSIICIIGGTKINGRRMAALATAYSLSESALREYTEKVVDTIGEKKEQSIRHSIAQDKVNADPLSQNEIIITNKGKTRCYDTTLGGGYFYSDYETIRGVVNDLNHEMMMNNYISVNDFYYALGRPPIELGDDLGWNIDNGLVEIEYSAVLADDHEPCLAISYFVAPRYDYRNLH